jgi:hypothetical protein
MSKSKKLFLVGVVIFVTGMAYFSYDVSKRTTFPGSKPQLQERIKERFLEKDSLRRDSIKTEP